MEVVLGSCPIRVAVRLAPAQPLDAVAVDFQFRGVDAVYRGRGGADVARRVGEAEDVAAVGLELIVVLALVTTGGFVLLQYIGVQHDEIRFTRHQIGPDGRQGQVVLLIAAHICHGGGGRRLVHGGEGKGQGAGGVVLFVHQVDIDGIAARALPGEGGAGHAQTVDGIAGVVVAGGRSGGVLLYDQVHRGVVPDGEGQPDGLAQLVGQVCGQAGGGQVFRAGGRRRLDLGVVAVDLAPAAAALGIEADRILRRRVVCRRRGSAGFIHHGPGQGGGDGCGVAHLVRHGKGVAVTHGRTHGEHMAGLPHQQLRTLQGGGHRTGHAFRAAAGVQQLAVGAVEGHGEGLHLVIDVGDLHGVGLLPHGDSHRVVRGQLQGGGIAGDGTAAVLLRSDVGDGGFPGGGGGEGHRPPGGGGLRQGDGEVPEGRGGNGFRILVAEHILIGNVSAVGIHRQGVGGGKGAVGIGGHRVQHPDGQVGGKGHLALAAAGGDGDGGLRRVIGDARRNRTVGMVVFILIYARIAQIVLAGQGDRHRFAGGAIGVLAVDEQVYTACLAVFRVISGGVFHLVDAGIACAAAGPGAVGDDIRQGRGDGGAAGVFEGEGEAAQIQPLGAVVSAVIVRNYRCQAESAFAHRYIAALVEGDPRRQDVYVVSGVDRHCGKVAVLIHQLEQGAVFPIFRQLRPGQVQAQGAVQGNGDEVGGCLHIRLGSRQAQGTAIEGQGLLRVLAQVCELHPQAARPVGGELHFKGGVGVAHRDDQGLGGGVVPVGQNSPVPDDVFPLHQVERGCGGRPLAVHLEGQRGVAQKGWVVLNMGGIFA